MVTEYKNYTLLMPNSTIRHNPELLPSTSYSHNLPLQNLSYPPISFQVFQVDISQEVSPTKIL
jgi:hypothetical protein